MKRKGVLYHKRVQCLTFADIVVISTQTKKELQENIEIRSSYGKDGIANKGIQKYIKKRDRGRLMVEETQRQVWPKTLINII